MKRLLLTILVLLTVLPAMAQKNVLKNIPYIDQRRFHYGFVMGIDMNNVIFEHTGKDWYAECPDLNPGFCVGLLGDMALTENLNLRVTPTLHFVSRKVAFVNTNIGSKTEQDLKSCNIEIPVSLKVATKRLNNYRPYVIAGASILYDLSKDKETPIVFKPFDFSIHIGLGCDTYLPFFKFCPELRFNLGLADMIDHRRKNLKDETLMQYTDAIAKARNKSISLILYFE